MSVWQFETNAESDGFCREILQEMVIRFPQLSEDRAIVLINRMWRGNPFTEEEDVRYHWTADDWARHIYEYVPQLIRSHGP